MTTNTNNTQFATKTVAETASFDNSAKSWRTFVFRAFTILVAVVGTIGLLYNSIQAYQIVLIVVLIVYFPLSYLSYLQSRANSHRERVKDDFQLLGLTTGNELDQIYNQIYNPRQFIIYISLTVLATLLGFGIFFFQYDIVALSEPIIDLYVTQVIFYSFLGAYVFSIYYVYRRYVTLDLQPNVYLYITMRIITVMALSFIVAKSFTFDVLTPSADTNPNAINTNATNFMPIIAFIIGYFPDTGLRWLTTTARRILGNLLERNEQQLSIIDGISLWHETRLKESGIDNVQNLAAADIKELLLHSRFSAQQLMHWVDQAILITNLSVNNRYKDVQERGIHTISALRLYLSNIKAGKLDAPDWDKTLQDELWAVYHAVETGPNLHYVAQYWQEVREYRVEVIKRSAENLLQSRFYQQTRTAATNNKLADALTSQLSQTADNLNLDLEDLETLFHNSSHALAGLSRVYIQRKRYTQAIAVLNKAIDLNNKNVMAYSTRGLVEATQGNYEKAYDDFEKAKSINLDDEVIFNSQGSAYFHQGLNELSLNNTQRQALFNKALDNYKQALSLNPKYAAAYYNRGLVYAQQGVYDKAISDFNQALRFEPNRYDAYIERGSIYLKLKNARKAISDFGSAIHYNRNNPLGYNNRAIAYIQAKQYHRALYDLDTAIDIDPYQAVLYLTRAQTYWRLEDAANTITNCTEALELDGSLSQAYKLRARAYEKHGQIPQAIVDLEQYLAFNPPDADKAQKHLGKLTATANH